MQYDDVFEDIKLVNLRTFDDILKVVLIKKKLPRNIHTIIISEIGQMRRIFHQWEKLSPCSIDGLSNNENNASIQICVSI